MATLSNGKATRNQRIAGSARTMLGMFQFNTISGIDLTRNTLSAASNAKVLIDAYWKERGGRAAKKAAPRKSDPKAKSSAVERHRSPIIVADEDSDVPAPPKKRGKPSKSVSDDEGHGKSSKRAKQNASASAASKKKARAPVEEEPEEGYVSMKQWKNAASWAHLVDHIETVERTEDDDLRVYFVLYVSSNEHVCTSELNIHH